MDCSDQRRKRKRFLKQSYSSTYLLPLRFIIVVLGFLSFLSLLSYTSPSTSSSLRPVLVASSLSLLSSSTSRTVKSVREFSNFFSPLRIESRVLFPDHVLVLVSGGKRYGSTQKSVLDRLECVYYSKSDGLRNGSVDFVMRNVLSVDENYDGFRSILRCPLAFENYSNVLHLKKKNGILREREGVLVRNQTVVKSWDNVAYAATRDGETAVVFVKGLNLRPDRESNDPSQFTCHYKLGKKWDRNGGFSLSTRAVTAAQEVVRCPLPKSVSAGLDKGQGIRVTVGLMPRPHSRAHDRVLMPSVAKIFDNGRRRTGRKHELCVCTMVWNQASAIREWIKYHSWLGVEKWFVYDNNSDDGIQDVIQELVVENYNVSRHVWPWIKTQEAGFSHCALRAKDECSWVSFMDVDEYYYFPYSSSGHERFRALGYAPQGSLRALVANLSSSSSDIAEIRTSCHSFGPSGLKSPPSQGVTVGYTCRLQSPERHKSIIRPDALDDTLLNVVHHFHLKKGYSYLNLPQSSAMINHYKYQVWEVFRAKFYRRVATYVADWKQNQNEGSRDRAPGLGTEAIEPSDWPQRFCEVWDTGLRDFVLANLADVSTGLLPWEMHSLSSV